MIGRLSEDSFPILFLLWLAWDIGPGFDPQEEEFIREMQRRKKKKKGIRL